MTLNYCKSENEEHCPSIQLDIIQNPNNRKRKRTPNESGLRSPIVPAAEKAITLFALRFAILYKIVSCLGSLGFIWATVVLLGGFAVTLVETDFWFVTIILLIEGAKIFIRRHEREWRQKALNLLFMRRFIIFSMILDLLPLISAIACVVMSLTKLILHDYGKNGDDTRNIKAALDIFYGLALAEGLMFLLEKVYWQWKMNYCKLLEKVCRECNLGPKGMAYVKRYFYVSYSKCIDGSLFDGLKMDLVSFGCEHLDSDSRDDQLMGANILVQFARNEQLSSHTLRRIGCSSSVIERLIEMVNWKNPEEEEIRKSAAEIVCKLAGKKHSAIRVATVTGAMESISSLLYTGKNNYDSSSFNLLGLMIFKKLARDHDNCYKIGNAKGVIPQIINFTRCDENLLRNIHAPESQIMIVKRALQLVKILVSTTGQTGKMLRKEISDIVFTVSNVREILVYEESHMVLQKLGIEVLTGLAMDEEARERIGCTGGVIRSLLFIYFRPFLTEEQSSVSAEAGEALAMLAMENARNCNKILVEKDAVENLIDSLYDPILRVISSRILRSLCAYSAPQYHFRLGQITSAVPIVLKAIMVENEKLLEVSIGLAKQIFRFLNPEEYAEKLGEAGISDIEFTTQLVDILKIYSKPDIKVPRIRRFTIELMICLMKFQHNYSQLFKNLEAEEVLKDVDENTSELESFNVFSGSVGLGRNNVTVSSLVDTAMELMA